MTRFFPLLKILVSFILFWIIFKRIEDFSDFYAVFKRIDILYVICAYGALLGNHFFSSLRFSSLSKEILNKEVGTYLSFKLSYIGALLSQILPGSVGGDVYKWYVLSDREESLPILQLLTSDRLWGMFFLCCAGCVGTLMDLRFIAYISIFLLGIMGFLGWLMIGDLILKNMPLHWRNKFSWLIILRSSSVCSLYAFMATFCLILSLFLCAKGLCLSLTFSQSFIVIPFALICASIPLSFAGWGVRESAFIFIFSGFGNSTEELLAYSLFIGFFWIVANLPSLLLLVSGTSAPIKGAIRGK